MDNQRIDERFVGFFDMLGMSKLSLRNPDVAWGALSDFADAKDRILNLEIQILSSKEVIRDRVRAFMFSDSIVVFTKSNQLADTYAIVILCSELFSIALRACVPLRGAIAHGRFLFNIEQNLFVGPPLVNAYRLSEDAQWLGIRVDKVVTQKANAIPLLSERNKPVIIDWEVPTKSGGWVKSAVIDWVETHRNNFKVEPPITIQQFYEAFIPMFGPYNELSIPVQNKYENTVAFINERLLAGN